MDDGPENRPEDRRGRRGPLGDEGGAEETTRRVPQRRAGGETGEEEATARRDSPSFGGGSSRGADGGEDSETRRIRTPAESSAGSASGAGTREGEAATRAPRGAPSGYPETSEDREDRLREVYGGVDWLASFIGAVFAVACTGVLLALAGLVLTPLGFTLDLGSRAIDAVIVAGLAVLGFVLFAAYFLGGYVAGRLVRFDGGRNGAATVLWGLLLSGILVVFGSFLPGNLFQLLQGFVQGGVLSGVGSLLQSGLVGLAVAAGAVLLEILGGFLGGRLGNGYHTRIDNTT